MWAEGHGCSSSATSENRGPRCFSLAINGLRRAGDWIVPCNPSIEGSGEERRRDRAFDDRSFGVPRLSVRVARDWPFRIASAAQREAFQNALDSETDALGPLTQNPGEGLGGPT